MLQSENKLSVHVMKSSSLEFTVNLRTSISLISIETPIELTLFICLLSSMSHIQEFDRKSSFIFFWRPECSGVGVGQICESY